LLVVFDPKLDALFSHQDVFCKPGPSHTVVQSKYRMCGAAQRSGTDIFSVIGKYLLARLKRVGIEESKLSTIPMTMAATAPPPHDECPPTPPPDPTEVAAAAFSSPPLPTLAHPLNIGDHCQVFCAAGEQHLAAVVIERRPSRCSIKNAPQQPPGGSTTTTTIVSKRKRTVDVATLAPDDVEYYVHYVEHDR
jgi:hypothetical protein